MKYDPPTYRNYENASEQWLEWKRQANALGFDEAKRHASVSINNSHRCRQCFCCACVEYVAESRVASNLSTLATNAAQP